MRSIITISATLLIIFNLSSQTYVLDSTFADNGKLKLGNYGNPNFTEAFLINDYCYLHTNSGVIRVSQNGDYELFNFNLGAIPGTAIDINIKHIGNNFYIYGYLSTTFALNNENMFIAKMSTDGIHDTSFGTNGIMVIDLGQNERIYGIIETQDGNLLCTGVRSSSTTSDNRKLISFKINPITGAILTDGNPQGFKQYDDVQDTGNYLSGGFINAYNGNYIVSARNSSSSSSSGNLILVNIDQNGSVITSYGTNGIKAIPTTGSTSTIDQILKVKIKDDKLYLNYRYYPLNFVLRQKLLEFDLTTDQFVFDTFGAGSKAINSFHFYDDGIYTTERNNSTVGYTDKYYLTKRSYNGQVDTNFHINGTYDYDSPTLSSNIEDKEDTAQQMLKFPDGSIFIAGYTRYVYGYTGTWPPLIFQGPTLIKIIPGEIELGTDDTNSQKLKISPNPFQNKISFNTLSKIDKVELFDLSGRKISEPKYYSDGNSIAVDLSINIQKGTYFIKISSEGGKSITQKIIKE